jgi:hypothetical protein
MPRASRLPPLGSASYYYRRSCATDRQLVRDNEELELLLQTLSTVLRRSGASLYAFHIDSAQLHFVIRAGSAPLVPTLGVFCHELTRQLNHRRGERGGLFVRRARITVFQPEVWLLRMVRYVHSIPPPANSLPSLNSDGIYRTRGRMTGLTTTPVMRALTSRNKRSSTLDDAYRDYFGTPPDPAESHLIERGSHEDSRILGDHAFITRVLQAQGLTQSFDVVEADSPDEVIRRAAELIIGRFHALCRRCLSEREARDWIRHTNLEQLRSKSRRMPLPLVRAMIAEYVLLRRLAKRGEVERYFGLHPKSLAAGLRRRYRSKVLARLSRGSGTAPHLIPDAQSGAQRVNVQLLVDIVAIVFDR